MSPHEKRADRLTQIQAQVDYHRQRLMLYQRLHGSRPGNRLAELEAAYASARQRLARASGDATRARATTGRSGL